MQIKNTTIKYLFLGSLFLAFFVASFSVLAVWDEPNSYTPNNNPDKSIQGPLNISGSNQQKVGPIILQTGFRSTGPIIFDDNPKFLLSGYAQNKVLTSDAEGNASWKDLQGGQSSVAWGSITENLEDQTDLFDFLQLKADLNSPTLTGDPQVPTPPLDDDDTSIANTEFVTTALSDMFSRTEGWTDSGTLVSLTSSSDNIQIGPNTIIYRGGNNDTNRFIHTNGTNNLFAGLEAGKLDISGQGNTGAGRSSLFNIGSGSYNTALGFQSLYTNVSGSNNTAAGYRALYNNTTNDNTAVGAEALFSNISGEKNTAFGYRALFNTTTSNNTAIGSASTTSNTAGNNSTFAGYLARQNSNGLSNVTAIGYNALVSSSNSMVFGNSSVTGWGFATQPKFTDGNGNTTFYAMRVGSNGNNNGNAATLTLAGVWTNASDLNKKTNIQNLNYGLKEVLQLRPVSFNWKDSNKHDIGFIAQEVKQIIPELVYGQEGDLSLAYSQLPVVLVNAVNEQQKEIEKYREELEALQLRLKALQD